MNVIVDRTLGRYHLLVFWFRYNRKPTFFRPTPLEKTDPTLYILDIGRLRITLGVKS